MLDPFCGRGTTLYAARLAGLPSVGIDINPVAAAIRPGQAHPRHAQRRCPARPTDPERRHVGHSTWGDFGSGATSVRRCGSRCWRCLRRRRQCCGRSYWGVLHGPRNKNLSSYLSNQMPRTYPSKPAYAVKFWKKRDMRPTRIPVLEVIERRAKRLLDAAPLACGGRGQWTP